MDDSGPVGHEAGGDPVQQSGPVHHGGPFDLVTSLDVSDGSDAVSFWRRHTFLQDAVFVYRGMQADRWSFG